MTIPEGLQFQFTCEVGSYQVSPDGRISLSSMADLFQEVAWRHADSAYFGRNLLANNQIWILSRLDIKVDKFPKWGDKIRLFTGGRGVHKLFAFREFMIWDEYNQVMARAMSSWLLVNADTKRVLKPDLVLSPKLFDPQEHPEWQPKKLVQAGDPIASEEVTVRLSDLDLNNHVNNTSYIRWVENLLFDHQIRPDALEINYLAECMIGEKVLLTLFCTPDGYLITGDFGEKRVFLAKV